MTPQNHNLRIGVFVCDCGLNIAGVVDTASVLALLDGAKELGYDTEEIPPSSAFCQVSSCRRRFLLKSHKLFWSEFIDHKRRPNFPAILEELSLRQDKNAPDFVIIGALALLVQNYLHDVAWWDIALLFRDEETLQKFAETMTAPGLHIEPMDDAVISTGDLVCLHTMWSFGRTWANVDYIYRPECFQFFI
jgi:hypothetical protein